MWSRKRLDISAGDLCAAIAECLCRFRGEDLSHRIEQTFRPACETIVCLSARSGLDLLLEALDWPRGSEVIVSALTIHDLPRIIAERGLVAVPADLDLHSAFPDPAALERQLTPRTRGVLVAHLMGSRQPMQPLVEFARSHQLFLIEDCAQAFTGDAWRGTPQADAALFSFGTIKTCTTLGGGLICIRDGTLAARIRMAQQNWPVQSRAAWLRRVFKYAALKMASTRPAYGALIRSCQLLGIDFDRLINRSVRGFAGEGTGDRIRRRPCTPLIAQMARRLARPESAAIAARRARGARLVARLIPAVACPGAMAREHSHWVFPVLSEKPAALIAALREARFDATQGASLCVVPLPPGHAGDPPITALRLLEQLVYIPCYTELPLSEVDRLASVVLAQSAAAGRETAAAASGNRHGD